MNICSFALLFCALGCVSGFRMKRNSAHGKQYIAGVPIYNYQKSPDAGTVAGSLESEKESHDWILMLKSDVSDEQLKSFCADSSTTCVPEGHAGILPFVVMQGTVDDLKELLVDKRDIVSFVEQESQMFAIPEIPENGTVSSTSTSWGLDRIGVSKRSHQGQGVHIYVLDTGVRTTHSDFGGRAIPTLQVTSNTPVECSGSTSCAEDVHGHGTHCAGTAGGTTYGVAPLSIIHGVKVLSDAGFGQTSWIVNAIDWVASKGERPAIISMSLGGNGRSEAYKVAIDAAAGFGVTVVVAAGNSNSDACNFSPAYVPSAITVGSTTSSDARSSFSNYGTCVEIWAPGSSITSAGNRDDQASATMSGTSMACPHVAGAAALLLEPNSGWSSTQVLTAMQRNAETDVLTDLKDNDVNKLLFVGEQLNCSLPVSTPGYDTAGCNTESGPIPAWACAVTCDTGYTGKAQASCNGDTFSFGGCETACSTYNCPNGYTLKPDAANIPGSDTNTCCALSCTTTSDCQSGSSCEADVCTTCDSVTTLAACDDCPGFVWSDSTCQVNYIDLGYGTCNLANGEPTYEYHNGRGSSCRQMCSASSACYGYSTSSSGNCLLWTQGPLVANGKSWGGAHCMAKASHQ